VTGPARRVGLIGDVHAEHRRLDASLEFLLGQGVDAICCTGDIADGVGDVDACCRLLAQANATVVAGNHDRWLLADRLRDVPDAHRIGDLGEASRDYLAALPSTHTIDTLQGPALLCHGVSNNDLRKVWPGSARMPIERSAELDALIAEKEFQFVFNGHMHYRVIVNFHALTLLNAGTLKGEHRPGVSILDFGEGFVGAFEFTDALTLRPVAELALRHDPSRRIWRDTQEFDSQWKPVALYAATRLNP
jgi:predicted phosphodiesterase